MQSLSPCTLHLDGRKQRTRSAVHSLDTASAARRISSTPIEFWSSSRSIDDPILAADSPHRHLCPWTLIVGRNITNSICRSAGLDRSWRICVWTGQRHQPSSSCSISSDLSCSRPKLYLPTLHLQFNSRPIIEPLHSFVTTKSLTGLSRSYSYLGCIRCEEEEEP